MQRIAIDPDFSLPADGILSAQVVTSLLSRKQATKRARQRIHLRIERLRRAAEAERVAARQRGYAEGIEVFETALQELRRDYRRHYDDTATLVRKCLERILLHIPPEDWLDATIASVLKGVRNGPDLSIMVHPDNLVAVENIIARRRNEHPGLSYLKVEPNPAFSSQECMIYAGSDVIEVSIPIILDELCSALMQTERINDVCGSRS